MWGTPITPASTFRTQSTITGKSAKQAELQRQKDYDD
jgi:hypothetical protein